VISLDLFDFSIFASGDAWLSLLTLTLLEVVLGIDNVVFLAIVVEKLPENRQRLARRTGLILALFMRIALLFALSWVLSLRDPLFSVLKKPFSGRDLILLGGGLFLIAKTTHEMFEKLEHDTSDQPRRGSANFFLAIVQILALDVIFSLDSVITAVGMAKDVLVMMIAMVLAMIVMLVFAGRISRFIVRHPSMRVLALSFLLLIGVLLVAEGMGQHINKGYIYFAMGFALVVELIKLRVTPQRPVQLHTKYPDAGQPG
jgi:predicted tellurium resistance membrane protein TerC